MTTPKSYKSFALTAAAARIPLSLSCGSSLSVITNSRLDPKLGALVVKI